MNHKEILDRVAQTKLKAQAMMEKCCMHKDVVFSFVFVSVHAVDT